MRRAFGPIFTTGAALTAAAVVVANPVIPPRSDVQIPAIQLSAGAGDALGMLDEDFLKAIAPAPPGSTNPFVIIRDLITSLAADATYLGKNAIVDAFVAGATAVTQPELTATSLPYVPDAPSPYQAGAMTPLPAPLSPLSLEAVLPADLGLPAADLSTLTPAVAEVVTAVVHDVSYMGNQLVTAAFAAGAVLAAEPALIVDTLWSLMQGDVHAALESAAAAVSAPFGPTGMILEAINTVIARRLPDPRAVNLPVIDPPAEPKVSAPSRSVSLPIELDAPRPRRGTLDTPTAEPRPVDEPRPVVEVPAAAARALDADAERAGLDSNDDNRMSPGQRLGSGPVGRAVTEVADRAKTALRNAGDAVRQATERPADAGEGPSGE